MIVNEYGKKDSTEIFSVYLLDLTYSVILSSTELETDSSSDKEVSDQESSCQH